MTGFGRLALISAVGVYLLIVMGATVRVTGSGLGCPDWPLCHGQLLPPPDFHAIVEYVHRTIAALVGIPLLLLFVGAVRRRAEPLVFWPVTAMMVLLIPQVLLGREVVLRELPPMLVAVHLAVALLILALVTFVAVRSVPQMARSEREGGNGPRQGGVAIVTIALFATLLTGAYMRASGASWVCNGQWVCGNEAHMLHRTAAILIGGAMVWLAWQHRFWWLSAALLAQIGLGVAMVSVGPRPELQIGHVAMGSAAWAGAVALVTCVGLPASWGAYLALTKPRIIVLLLITATGGMFLAAEGVPPLGILAATLLGGALSAGGANAINCYIDRDIDGVMSRTTLRPIPAGIIRPRDALRFGLALTVASLLVFGLLVNWLAGAIALGAMLYYVFVYTRWLKRSTPSNIVIGGAAGALPPVIGWAAVRGELGLLPLWLFAIIFYWTPPHFWALSLLIKREYERARIPMLPIVRGEAETRRQILWYSLLMVAVTAVLTPLGLMGGIYLAAAVGLGALFVWLAIRLLREGTSGAARRLFRYSLYYLTGLFVAMVIDRRVPL